MSEWNYVKSDIVIGTIPSVQNCNDTKLENSGLNLYFMKSAIQPILAIKPLSDLLCYRCSKPYSKLDTFQSEYVKIKKFNDPNKSIHPNKWP